MVYLFLISKDVKSLSCLFSTAFHLPHWYTVLIDLILKVSRFLHTLNNWAIHLVNLKLCPGSGHNLLSSHYCLLVGCKSQEFLDTYPYNSANLSNSCGTSWDAIDRHKIEQITGKWWVLHWCTGWNGRELKGRKWQIFIWPSTPIEPRGLGLGLVNWQEESHKYPWKEICGQKDWEYGRVTGKSALWWRCIFYKLNCLGISEEYWKTWKYINFHYHKCGKMYALGCLNRGQTPNHCHYVTRPSDSIFTPDPFSLKKRGPILHSYAKNITPMLYPPMGKTPEGWGENQQITICPTIFTCFSALNHRDVGKITKI